MSTTEVSALLGVIVPLVVAFVTTVDTSSKVKGWLALGISVAVGLITTYTSGALTALSTDPATVLASLLQNVTVVAVAAQTAYSMFIKPSGLAEKIQAEFGYTTTEEDDTDDTELEG
jgi:hypothetical protein